jgi:hypothetical protein
MCETDLFLCPHQPGGLRLRPCACADLWRRGQGAPAWDASRVCRGCALGAQHAGVPTQAVLPVLVCVRCGATDGRMIKSKGVCVSCYNREREVARGRDRRGQVPRHAGRVVTLTVQVNGWRVSRSAAGPVELALWALQAAPGARVTRWVPAPQPMQLSLWAGLAMRQARPRVVTGRPRLWAAPVQLALPLRAPGALHG